jgi:N-acetylneuraminic acid mutarotase
MKPTSSPWVAAIFIIALSTWLNVSHAEETDQGKWTPTGSLLTARVCHRATLLPDGRVLIVGGFGNAGDLSSVELYDPKERVFTQASDMSTGRCYNTSTLLPNGKVLVVGGQYQGNTLASAELYDPKTNTWTNTGSLHVARSYHTATLLPNGKVLVVGGTRLASPPVFAQGTPPEGALDLAELYDPASGKWTVTDNLHVARFAHTANLLTNGQVLVAGGLGGVGGDSILASSELYNPKTGSWKITDNLLLPLFNQFSISLPGGQAFLVGGKPTLQTDAASTELYNLSNGTWSSPGNSHTGINGPCAILPNGKVLVAGGAVDGQVLTAAELYNQYTKTWEMTGSMNKARCGHTETLLKDGSVLVTGGLYELGSPMNVITSAELYNAPDNSNQDNKLKDSPSSTTPEVIKTPYD